MVDFYKLLSRQNNSRDRVYLRINFTRGLVITNKKGKESIYFPIVNNFVTIQLEGQNKMIRLVEEPKITN